MKENNRKTNDRLRRLVIGLLGVGALSGWFGAASAGELTGSVATGIPPMGYDLTGLGTSDWVHWGRARVYANFDRKNGVTPLITNVTTMGGGEVHGAYFIPERKASWSDGKPTASATDDNNYIWSNGATNSGFQFTVKADTTERTLYVLGGGASVEGTLTAHLSDASATDYVDVQNVPGNWRSLYTINYRADSADQTLTIKYLKTSTNGMPIANGSVDLKAAWLIEGAPNEPPAVRMAAPTNNASYTAPAEIALTADATDNDGTVTNVEFFANNVSIGSASASPFRITWSAVPAGSYSIKAKATDNRGTYIWSAPIAVGVNPGGGGPTYAGLALWLKADAGVTLNANGTTVAAWADQSGMGRNAVQATAASQPTLVNNTTIGKTGVSFDGLNDFLTFNLPVNDLSGMTIVLVANNRVDRNTTGGNYAAIFWNQTQTDGRLYLSPFQSRVHLRFGTKQANNNPVYTRPSSIGDDYSLTVARKDQETESLYVDGTEVWNDGGYKWVPIAGCDSVGNLGRGYNNNTYFAGDILEVLVYTRALSDTERDDVYAYLDGKWLSNARPTVTLVTPANDDTFSAPVNITLTATASDGDGTVTNVEFYAGSTLIGSDSSSPFSIVWNDAPPGTYQLTAKAMDNGGAYRTSAPIEILVSTTGGAFSTAVTALGNTTNKYNLQELGRAGWAHWGRAGTYANLDRSVLGSQISAVTPVGIGEIHGATTNTARFVSHWSGWPTGKVIDDKGYIWSNGALDTGFSFTAPADTNQRTLYVYCGGRVTASGNSLKATLTARLTDASAADFVDAQSITDTNMNLYAITYKAGSNGQKLKITYLKTEDVVGGGNVDLMAAWLVDGPPNTLPSVAIASPADNATFNAGAGIAMTATASDSDGTVTNVEYYAGSVLVGSASSSPYSATWTAVPTGRYTLTARATDNLGGIRVSRPITAIVGGGGVSPVSDDFNSPSLNRLLWSTIDGLKGPRGAIPSWGASTGYGPGTSVMWETIGAYSGEAVLRMTVPEGNFHDAYSINEGVQIMQAVPNADFDVEVKFNTLPAGGPNRTEIHSEGILAEDTNGVSLRFEFWYNAGAVYFLSIKGVGSGTASNLGTPQSVVLADVPVPTNGVAGVGHLRVKRVGDTWTAWTAPGPGTNWTQRLNITNVITLARLGIHGINADFNTYVPSQFPVEVDYFLNRLAPIVPEDGGPLLKITLAGSQAVLSWPNAATGFAPETTPSLSPPGWTAVTNSVVPVGDQNTVTVDLAGSESYYRLKK